MIADPAFFVRVLASAPAATTTDAPAPAISPAAGVASVLVVDDQFTVRELQRSILEAAGYAVTTAADGREALDLLGERDDIDLVVTDLEMPRLGGLEMLETLRADDTLRELPVVVVTSRGSEDDRRRGSEAGADAYVVKDEFNQEALLETVSRLARP